MQHLHPDDAIALIIAGEMSMSQAAKLCGVAKSTLSRKAAKNPDYVRAVAEGRVRGAPEMPQRDVNDLRNHPAVVDVVVGGLTYTASADKHGEVVATVHRWVKKAYPEFEGLRKVGPRTAQPLPSHVLEDGEFITMQRHLRILAARLKVPTLDLGLALAKLA